MKVYLDLKEVLDDISTDLEGLSAEIQANSSIRILDLDMPHDIDDGFQLVMAVSKLIDYGCLEIKKKIKASISMMMDPHNEDV